MFRFSAFFFFLRTPPRFVSVLARLRPSAWQFTQTPLHTNERFALRYRFVLQRSFFACAFRPHFKPLQFSPRSAMLRVPFISAAFRSPRFPLLSFRLFGLSATLRFAAGTPPSSVPSFIQPKAFPTRSGPLSRPRKGKAVLRLFGFALKKTLLQGLRKFHYVPPLQETFRPLSSELLQVGLHLFFQLSASCVVARAYHLPPNPFQGVPLRYTTF